MRPAVLRDMEAKSKHASTGDKIEKDGLAHEHALLEAYDDKVGGEGEFVCGYVLDCDLVWGGCRIEQHLVRWTQRCKVVRVSQALKQDLVAREQTCKPDVGYCRRY